MSRVVARRDRIAAATGALLLQLGFIAAFLHAFSAQAPTRQLVERELTFFLPRLIPKPAPVQPTPRAPAAPLNIPAFAPSPLSIVPALPAAPTDNSAILQNLGRSLFGCAPENLDRLTPQDRARCGTGFAPPDGTVFAEPRSQVKDPLRRMAEMAEKNTPAKVPCEKLESHSLGFNGGQETTVMADPVCVLNGLANGFHLTGLPP